MAKSKNPRNKDEKQAAEVVGERIEPSIETDVFSVDEQKKIVNIVMSDIESGLKSQQRWVTVKKYELLHIHAEKPSIIENLKKEKWQSDRNLGALPGILDIFQSKLLATCYNPNSIHYVATEKNDVDQKDNLAKFTKWGLGKNEANFFPEVDDFIANRVGHGFSCFKVTWEVKYEWIDKRVPKYSKLTKKKTQIVGYDIKTEERRFERGVIKNIDNIDDIILPSYGKDVQDLEFFIERIHLSYQELERMSNRNVIKNFDKDTFKSVYQGAGDSESTLRGKKLALMDFTEEGSDNMTNMPIDCYEWYGMYTKNGKTEKYRFLIEPLTEKLLAGKPVRKINRDGNIPYAGGPLRRVPGLLRGGSLTTLISNLINALNNNYNQTVDYQYAENVPFGFANLSEFGKGDNRVTPGDILNVDETPVKDHVYYPNFSRSLAWSYQDKDFLMQMIERLTGAASYFLTTDAKQATATRDSIVNEKSETKFGLWVKRIQYDICEAINMWIALYQEYAPRNLSERVLGEDGEQLFKNLSIDDLKGKYDSAMIPDITSGSKIYEKQVKMWGLQMSMASPWFNPQINPQGSWKLMEEAMKANGYENAEDYLPPMPKDQAGSSDEVKQEFFRMMQGETIDPDAEEGLTPLVVEHFKGHMQQKEERYNELSEEYRPIFDNHLFATQVNYMKFIKQQQNEQQANAIAMDAMGKMQEAAKSSQGAGNGQPGAGTSAITPEPPLAPTPQPEGDIVL